MKLSRRLLQIASLVTEGNVVADVGTDHGYVPIYLIQEKRIPSAIAMDINPGPIQRAREHIEASGLADVIDTRLSDGVAKLQVGEADTLILAGMGGQLMTEIMRDGKNILDAMKEYILQPQSEWSEFRHFLCDNGYFVAEEQMLCEEGKYYQIIRAVRGNEHYSEEIFYAYGKRLLEGKNEVLYEFLKKERDILYEIVNRLSEESDPGIHIFERLLELKSKSEYNAKALSFFL